jgi:O-antigen biosynthesis protein WbqP
MDYLKHLNLLLKMLNRILAVVLFILLLPLIFIIAIIITIEDGRPVFFKQRRVGVNSKLFTMYKFRTMKLDTPNVATHLLKNPGQYLLKIGIFLRKSSLDELPNLINIIKGDMVFVGPRPALYNQADLLSLRIAAGVDQLKPGITGWAQVNGRDLISIEEKVALDHIYLKRKSFLFDLRILGTTVSKVLKRNGVAH